MFEALRHLWLPLQLRAEQRRIVEKHGEGFGRAAMAEMRYAEALSGGPADLGARRHPVQARPHCCALYQRKFLLCSCRACFALASVQCIGGFALPLPSHLCSAGSVLADLSRNCKIQKVA